MKTEEENRSLIKESAFFKDEKFSLFGDSNSQKFKASSPLALPSTTHQPISKHKHKKSSRSRSKERKHKSEKKKLDARCVLTLESLEKDKVRVLTAMGGLFYAGCLSAITPPDVYAITLDGERGNRPHIMSREEILRDAVSFNALSFNFS